MFLLHSLGELDRFRWCVRRENKELKYAPQVPEKCAPYTQSSVSRKYAISAIVTDGAKTGAIAPGLAFQM
jgi:hypothetical protein